MKEFTEEQFEKQNKFIAGKFEDQKRFINDEFSQQTGLLLDQTDRDRELLVNIKEMAEEEFQQVKNDLKTQIEELKDFLVKEKIDKLFSLVKGVLEEIKTKHIFLDSFHGKNINENLAISISIQLNVLESKEIVFLKEEIKRICLNTELMKCKKIVLPKKMCTNILYTYFTIKQFQDITILALINLLVNTDQKQSIEGYLDVYHDRKEKFEKWVFQEMVSNTKIACPLFKTRPYYWQSQKHLLGVLGYLDHLDPKVKQGIVDLNIDDCLAIEKSNDKECCACKQDNILIQKSGLSSSCDIKGQCKCKENYKELKCNECQQGFFGYPKCSECGCDEVGSVLNGTSCDQQGQCTCKARNKGTKCSECIAAAHYGPQCIECGCNKFGSVGQNCDQKGKCTCKGSESRIKGTKCSECKSAAHSVHFQCQGNIIGI